MGFDGQAYEARVNAILEQMRKAQGIGSPVAGTPGYPAEYEAQYQQQGAGLPPGANITVAKGVSKLIGGGAPATSTLASTEAANAAWNAGANAATAGSTQLAAPELISATRVPTTSISNFAGTATPYLGAAGAAAGAYGAYKGIKDKNPLAAGLGGAGAGLGLNMMGYALGPYGWAAMLAAPAAAALINKLGDKDRWKTEQSRADKLKASGINWDVPSERLTHGRSKDELIQRALASGGNVDFARTRDEKYLKPEDIWGYSAFGEKYGDKWLKGFSESQRRSIAQSALDSGAVNEHKGTIDIDWSKLDSNKLSGLESALSGGNTRSKTRSPGIDKNGKRISY